jgi:hypothetical protein
VFSLKKWIQKNKKLLVIFGIISLVTLVVTLIELNLILSNTADLEIYTRTGIISDSLKSVSLLGLLNVALIGTWSLCLAIVMFKLLLPDKRSVDSAFCLSELNYLLQLPDFFRKGRSANE